MSYSQNNEDDFILSELEALGCTVDAHPKLLEIGAFHPKALSNSRLFIEAGWSAVLVEASPYCAGELISEYGKHPRVQVICCAVWPSGLQSNPCRMKITKDATSTAGAPFPGTNYEGEAYIGVLGINEMLDQFGRDFDYVSIDAEGTSVELALAYLEHVWPLPKVMCIEHNGRVIEFFAQVQDKGYHITRLNGENMIISLCRPKT